MHIADEEGCIAIGSTDLINPTLLHPITPIIEMPHTPVELSDLPVDDRLGVGTTSRLVAFISILELPWRLLELLKLVNPLIRSETIQETRLRRPSLCNLAFCLVDA